jgi:periplasmic protein TonB
VAKQKKQQWLWGGLGVSAVALLGWVTFMGIQSLMGGAKPPPARQIQQITLVPPPPPPPPPKIEEPPPPEPEPEVVEEPPPAPEPQQAEAEPVAEELGVDAEGGAGSDGFGLKGKKGGSSLIGGGSIYRYYAGALSSGLKKQIDAALSKNKELRGSYSLTIALWVDSMGRINRFEIHRPTGNTAVDDAIEKTITEVGRVKEPPQDLPQPIMLRITSRV